VPNGLFVCTIVKIWRRILRIITVVWETWLKADAKAKGLRLTRQIWSDMRAFEGYVSHHLLVDQDAVGHIIVAEP
jgi:hypothetical protein